MSTNLEPIVGQEYRRTRDGLVMRLKQFSASHNVIRLVTDDRKKEWFGGLSDFQRDFQPK